LARGAVLVAVEGFVAMAIAAVAVVAFVPRAVFAPLWLLRGRGILRERPALRLVAHFVALSLREWGRLVGIACVRSAVLATAATAAATTATPVAEGREGAGLGWCAAEFGFGVIVGDVAEALAELIHLGPVRCGWDRLRRHLRLRRRAIVLLLRWREGIVVGLGAVCAICRNGIFVALTAIAPSSAAAPTIVAISASGLRLRRVARGCVRLGRRLRLGGWLP
jgi:hypothetical protein